MSVSCRELLRRDLAWIIKIPTRDALCSNTTPNLYLNLTHITQSVKTPRNHPQDPPRQHFSQSSNSQRIPQAAVQGQDKRMPVRCPRARAPSTTAAATDAPHPRGTEIRTDLIRSESIHHGISVRDAQTAGDAVISQTEVYLGNASDGQGRVVNIYFGGLLTLGTAIFEED